MNIYSSDIKFSMNSNKFNHNFNNDYALFALWKNARPFTNDIRNYLQSKFKILFETEIEWSDENFNYNASRLYEVPIYKNKDSSKTVSGHAKKIGGNKFIIFIVKDETPNYNYVMSVSKKIELSNLNIVNAKYIFRDWIFKDSGIKYGVHSTNNINEFLFQAPLILGANLFDEIMDEKIIKIKHLAKDLEGANGWKSWKDIFNILNITSNYLVLRSFETLPNNNLEKDIDMLTDNYQRVASVLGAFQLPNKGYKGVVNVDSEYVSFDIRFIGDKYYDSSWQKEMLKSKVFREGVFVPRIDHYFFSLLYHCKVQKEKVKDKYYGILSSLSKELEFSWYNNKMLNEDESIGEILSGFLSGNNYYYEDPIDRMVYCNKNIIAFLPNKKSMIVKQSTKDKIKNILIKILPVEVINILKKINKWKR